jgi:hypothetical protein
MLYSIAFDLIPYPHFPNDDRIEDLILNGMHHKSTGTRKKEKILPVLRNAQHIYW